LKEGARHHPPLPNTGSLEEDPVALFRNRSEGLNGKISTAFNELIKDAPDDKKLLQEIQKFIES